MVDKQTVYPLHLKEYLGASLEEIGFILEAENIGLGSCETYLGKKLPNWKRPKSFVKSMVLLESQVRIIDDKINALKMMREGFMKRLEKCKNYEQEMEIVATSEERV